MRQIILGTSLRTVFKPVVLSLLFFLFLGGTASALSISGYTYNETKGPLGNTTVLIEEYIFAQGPPALIATYTNTSNASTGYFIISVPDNVTSNYKIILRHFNVTTGYLEHIGQSLPTFPFSEIMRLAQGGTPIDFYLRPGGTINITATNGTAPQNFSYMVKDTRLGYPIAENFSSEVANATIYVPASRNYSIEIYPNRSFPISYDLNNLTSYENYYANITFNTSNTLRKVSGYATLQNGSSNFTDLKIIAYLLEPGSMVFQDHPLPYNMSVWCLQQGCAPDVYNATNGSFNMTLPGAAMTANILLFATASKGSDYYGAFRNISLGYSNDTVNNFNFTMQTLLGNVTNISVTNAGGMGGPPGTTDITTKKVSFWIQNSSGANITNAHIEVKVNYSAYNGSAFSWMVDISPSSNSTFSIPALNADISKINIYTQGSAPLKTSRTAAELAISPVRINLSAFNPGRINISEGPPPIFIDMLKNTPVCDVPYPQAGCSLFPNMAEQNMTAFDPFRIVVGGGKISFRMRSNFNNITVHYKNVDLLASGPPDALFDSNASQSQNGSSLANARRFGSMGPEIYDEVLIGIPLASGIIPTNVTVKFGKLFNDSWGEIWNSSAGNTTDDLPSDYVEFNTSYFSPSGMQCSTGDQNALCYVNLSERMVWLRFPHFSGVDATISGTSGNFTATLDGTALAGNRANLNFTLNDTANTTSWYNITFPAGFDATTAGINFTINGTLNPGGWTNLTAPSFVNVTSISAAAADLGTAQYINISGITVPSVGGIYAINVTTDNNVVVSLNYTVISYGANLTVDSNEKTTSTSANATYSLTLRNNGSVTDTYNLTIDNPDIAATAALNVSGNVTLASNAAQTILLNVTNSTYGIFRVNVTARSNNDSSKSGYINTTTTVVSYGVNLTNVSALSQTVIVLNNASYIFSLHNNGSASDTYNLTVSNPNSASTAALNISGNVTLASNVTQMLALNVTNTSAGTFYVNVTVRSNNDPTKYGYINTTTTVNYYGVNLTVDSASRTKTATQNATYTLILTNNGSTMDSYNLTVVNTDSASTAALNVSGNITLAQNAAQTLTLNVTNATRGTFRVDVIARSNNDSTKTGYINTTTTVDPVPIGVTITSPSNNSVNTTGYVNITATLNITGTALLNWEGTNESMSPEGAGTSFYKNKTGLLSGDYTFRIYATSTDGATNVSDTRIVTVNRTNTTSLGSIINVTTFIVNASLDISSPSGNVTVTVPNGTNASVNNAALASISIDSIARVNSTYSANLSSTDRLIGENLTLGPDGARFSPDIQIRFNYTAAQLTAAGVAESSLGVKFYNTSSNAWEALTIYSRDTTADYVIANVSHFTTFALTGTPSTTTTTTTSGTSGGGSSGGALFTTEPFDNIAKSERYEKVLYANSPVAYLFKAPEHGIYEIAVTGKENENYIEIRVEALKGTSKLVTRDAPGTVYKNLNIWAASKKLKEAMIRFKVENSWIDSNKFSGSDIKMVKWDGSQWNTLETSVKSKDGDYTYLEAKTDAFSNFAITVPGAAPKAVAGETPSRPVQGVQTPEKTTAPEATGKAPGFDLILAIAAIGILSLRGRKR